jgi:hypothetical protein
MFMEEPGHWRHYVWWAGLLVAVAVGAYTGSHRPTKPSASLSLSSGIVSISLAAVAILPARISPRQKAVRMAVTAAIYTLLGWIVYYVQDPYATSWKALGENF